jgi:hypothetical protein
MDKHFRYAIHSYTTTHHCSNEATCILSSLSHFGTIKCAVRCCLDYDILALAALVLLVVRSFCALDLHHQDIFSFSHVDPLTLAWSILCFLFVFHSHSRACCGFTFCSMAGPRKSWHAQAKQGSFFYSATCLHAQTRPSLVWLVQPTRAAH